MVTTVGIVVWEIVVTLIRSAVTGIVAGGAVGKGSVGNGTVTAGTVTVGTLTTGVGLPQKL
jgi:hypothetical protein